MKFSLKCLFFPLLFQDMAIKKLAVGPHFVGSVGKTETILFFFLDVSITTDRSEKTVQIQSFDGKTGVQILEKSLQLNL